MNVKFKRKKATFFSENLVEWKIVSTFALAFEKSSITQSNIRKSSLKDFT